MKTALQKRCAFLLLPAGFFLLAGCSSHYVQATIENHTDGTLRQVEVDYPSASFGTNQIASQSAFHYRFKVQGSGDIKISFTDAGGKAQNATGPQLSEGELGALHISVEAGNRVTWSTDLTEKR
jgi:hypothetical protein